MLSFLSANPSRFTAAITVTLCLGIISIPAISSADSNDPARTRDSGQLSEGTRDRLDEAFDTLIQGLQKAKSALENKQHAAPKSTDRVLAEGYRYLLAHLNRAIEFELRADPEFPEFFRSMSMLRKWTGENPDAMYLKAPIDGEHYYKVTGRAANHQEWKTSERGVDRPKAPRVVTFQTITDAPGFTGELTEMASCKNQNIDFTNGLKMHVEKDGRFEILIGPEKPRKFRGNFLYSRKELGCPATGESSMREAQWLAVREIFSDWENEVPLELEISRFDRAGTGRAPITIDEIVEKMERIAIEVPNQIRFWNLVLEYPMELHRDANGDGQRPLPVNGINKPAPPFTAGGVAGAKQIYASGIFDLADDEALVVKVTCPVEPHYIGFQLNNVWMEGPDQQNHVSSLTGHQLPIASDGSRYYIISHRDPGMQGWVATTGIDYGFHAMRFLFREDPEENLLPSAEAFHVKLDELASVLPDDTPKISAEQRKFEVSVRQQHIKLRWRGH